MICKSLLAFLGFLVSTQHAPEKSPQTAPTTRPVPAWVTIPQDAFPRPELGMTLEQLETLLKEQNPRKHEPTTMDDGDRNEYIRKVTAMHAEHEPLVRHQFTVRRDDRTMLCVTPQTASSPTYFIFIDGSLARITKLPPVTGKTVERDGLPVWEPEPIDPEKRLETVMQRESLTPDQFVVFAKESMEYSINTILRKSEPLPLPPELLEMELEKAEEEFPQRQAMFLRVVDLLNKYDPMKIKPGMTRQDVEAEFGAPQNEHAADGKIECTYGEDIADEKWAYYVPWVVIAYKDERVAGVWSHDFLNKTLVPSKAEK